ncbi:MAG: hypothetical protein HC884_02750 [Chloroflexaceae bacterium]|nr:hypothetical protein [Chloroflexaceae bacterium]
MKTYQLSSRGQRTTLILLVTAFAIWGFALWSFRSTLNISYHPLRFWASLSASIEAGLSVSQIIPSLLMLVLIVATPLLVWNLLEEWVATYTPTEEGLRFTSLGVDITYPWSAIHAIRRIDDDSEDPVDELLIQGSYHRHIRNPLVRFLHVQAYGRHRLPIYAGLEARDDLLATVQQRMGPGGQDDAPLQAGPPQGTGPTDEPT